MKIENIVDGFIEKDIIENEDKEIYLYGLKYGLFMILNILTIIIIGALFKLLLESIIFIIFYMPLRSYAGGFHADTAGSCYIFSIALTIIVMIMIKHIPPSNYIILFFTIISALIIFLLSPVDGVSI